MQLPLPVLNSLKADLKVAEEKRADEKFEAQLNNNLSGEPVQLSPDALDFLKADLQGLNKN